MREGRMYIAWVGGGRMGGRGGEGVGMCTPCFVKQRGMG